MALFNRPIRLLTLALLLSLLAYISYTNYHTISNESKPPARIPYPTFKRPKSFPPIYNHRWAQDDLEIKDMRHPNRKLKAAMVTFVRNGQLEKTRYTIRSLEDSFNRDRNYPYVILSDQELTDEFKEKVQAMTKATVLFSDIPDELWGYPAHTDQNKASKAREDMADTISGDSEDYRFQSRFMSGPLYDHPAIKELDYYWRFEVGSEYVCPLDFDPFQYMHDKGKKISFSITLFEYKETIPTIWKTVNEFIEANGELAVGNKKDGAMNFVKTEDGDYNLCHFWGNFQIASVAFFRSKGYKAFFNHIDQSNGIFYERWGDFVIQTLAAVVLLRKDEIHHWEDIGYRIDNFLHCPNDKNGRFGVSTGDGSQGWLRCSCKPHENFDWNSFSCLRQWNSA
jgi:alpha 1,2-mannosyltransferase